MPMVSADSLKRAEAWRKSSARQSRETRLLRRRDEIALVIAAAVMILTIFLTY